MAEMDPNNTLNISNKASEQKSNEKVVSNNILTETKDSFNEVNGHNIKNIIKLSLYLPFYILKHLIKPWLILQNIKRILNIYQNQGLNQVYQTILKKISHLQHNKTKYGLHKLFYIPKRIFYIIKKLQIIYRYEGFKGINKRLMIILKYKNRKLSQYNEWFNKYEIITDNIRYKIKKKIAAASYKPLISVLMPTYNSNKKFLTETIESVRNQIYENWELCIADDASTQEDIKQLLKDYMALDKRIKVVFREQNGHISEASNSALQLVIGDFIAFLDHDDRLPEHALYMVMEEINKNPEADLIYSDEDKIDSENNHFDPHFKPDWNPILLLSMNYLSHLTVCRASLVKEVGGFRSDFNGSQDYDLFLRIINKTNPKNICHIPHILYHWRAVAGSTAASISYKEYTLESASKAVANYLEYKGIKAQVKRHDKLPYNRFIFELPFNIPKVAIIIPTYDKIELLSVAIKSILQYEKYYPNFEIIIINNNSRQPETYDYFNKIKENKKVKVINYNIPFNWSKINNYGVKQTDAEIFCFMNNDIKVISPEWLKEMVSYFVYPNIAAVGAKLYYPNDSIQHAGVVLGIGGTAGHIFKNYKRYEAGYFSRLLLPQNYSAVTGACLMVDRKAYEHLDGFDEELPIAFNDVDFSIRLIKAGYQIVWTPHAEMYHYESASRGSDQAPDKIATFQAATTYMLNKHADLINRDPAFNPNLSLTTEDIMLAFPPYTKKPWQEKAAFTI